MKPMMNFSELYKSVNPLYHYGVYAITGLMLGLGPIFLLGAFEKIDFLPLSASGICVGIILAYITRKLRLGLQAHSRIMGMCIVNAVTIFVIMVLI